MADFTHHYVDPSGGNDTTGNGTIGTPWKTVQKALNTITRDATNGNQINVKAGGTDTLTAELTTLTYGTATFGAPLVIRGYTSVANDGGKGTINGGGVDEIWNESAKDHIHFVDMILTNGTTLNALRVNSYCSFIRCEIHGQSVGVYLNGSYNLIQGCHFHNIGGIGINGSAGIANKILDNYFKSGASDFTTVIELAGSDGYVVERNIISIDGTSIGIDSGSTSDGHYIANNSIFSSGGTGKGMDCTSWQNAIIINNLVEGFSGSGGVGILLESTNSRRHLVVRANSVYNCATAFSNLSSKLSVEQDPSSVGHGNETLVSSPFAKSGSDTFANRFTYFAPVATGSVIGGAYVGT